MAALGFSVHTSVTVSPDDRDGLKRLTRQTAAVAGGVSAVVPPRTAHEPTSLEWRAARRGWAQLIRRIYEVDPLVCPRCGGQMRIIAFLTELSVIGKILRHLADKFVDARIPASAVRPQPDANAGFAALTAAPW